MKRASRNPRKTLRRRQRRLAILEMLEDRRMLCCDDPYEPNDNKSEVHAAIVGAENSANLGRITATQTIKDLALQDDADWFSFEIDDHGTSHDFVQISFDDTEGDLDLLLFDSSGSTQVGSSRSSSSDKETISLAQRGPGRYYAQVIGRRGDKNESYTLFIDPPGNTQDDQYEVNDSAADAGSGQPGAAHSPNLGTLNETTTVENLALEDHVDWFAFETIDYGTSHDFVSLAFQDADGDLDLFIYQEDGTTEVGRANSSFRDVELVSLAKQPAGRYFAKIVGRLGDANASYSLTIDPPGNTEDDDYEINDTPADADNGQPGHSSSPNLGLLTDSIVVENLALEDQVDWFVFQTADFGTSHDSVKIEFKDAEGDLDLFVYQADGTTQLGRANSSFRDVEEVSLAQQPPGKYYAKVLGRLGDANANYRLAIDPPGNSPDDNYEVNDSRADADLGTPGADDSPNLGKLVDNMTVSGLALEDQSDWFVFETTDFGTSHDYVQIDFQDADGDLDLFVYLSDGVTEVGRANSSFRDIEQVSLAQQSPGTFYAKVVGRLGDANAAYSLHINPPGNTTDDLYEVNDSPADVRTREPGETNSPNLGQLSETSTISGLALEDQVDWYTFATSDFGTSHDYVQIEFRDSEGDLDLFVYRSDGTTEVGRANSSFRDVELVSLAQEPPGRFYAAVVGRLGDANASYSLKIDPPGNTQDDRFEVNDSRQAADDGVPGGANSPHLGTLEDTTTVQNLALEDQVDWFVFETTDYGTSHDYVQIEFRDDEGDLDLFVYQADGTTEVGRSNSSFRDAERVSLATQAPGKFYAAVVGRLGDANPEYTLRIDPPGNSLDDVYEKNDSPADADAGKPSTEGSPHFGKLTDTMTVSGLALEDQADWFVFETTDYGTSRDFVQIDFNDSQGDLDLYVLASDGTTEIGRSNTSFRDSEIVSLAKQPPGRYYAAVVGRFGDANASYQLRIDPPGNSQDDEFESNDSRFEVNQYLPGRPKSPNIGAVTEAIELRQLRLEDQADWYRFEVAGFGTEDHRVRIDFTATKGDLDLEVYHSDGTSLVGRDSRSSGNSATVSLNSVGPGVYYAKVYDNRGTANDDYALQILAPEPNVLTVDEPLASKFESVGEVHYYKLIVPMDETFIVTLDSDAEEGANELLVMGVGVPTPDRYDARSDPAIVSPDQELVVTDIGSGTYFLAVRNLTGAAGTSAYQLHLTLPGYTVRRVTPQSVGNAGWATLTIDGTQFSDISQASVVASDGEEIFPESQRMVDGTRIVARFNLIGRSAGKYDVRVRSAQTIQDQNLETGEVFETVDVDGDAKLSQALTINDSLSGELTTRLLLPEAVRFPRVFPFQLEVTNDTPNDVPSPVVLVTAPGGSPISLQSEVPEDGSNQQQVLVLGEGGRTFLAPGETVVVPLFARGLTQPVAKFRAQNLNEANTQLDWDSLESYYRDISGHADWDQTWTRFKGLVGSTWGQLHAVMRQLAELESGSNSYLDAGQLMRSLLNRAHDGAESIGESDLAAEHQVTRRRRRGGGADGCGDYRPTSGLVLDAAELYIETFLYPYLQDNYGKETLDLWKMYVSSTPAGIQTFSETDPIITGSSVAPGFKNSLRTRSTVRDVLSAAAQELQSRFQSAPGTPDAIDVRTLPPNSEVSYDITALLGADQLDSSLTAREPGRGRREGASTGNLADSLNYNFVNEIPGNIAGGIGKNGNGSDKYGDDRRQISGSVLARRIVDEDGKTVRVELTSQFRFRVEDTIDFCPGDLGTLKEQLATRPLKRLEANGRAHDVHFIADFLTFSQRQSIPVNDPIEPPANDCVTDDTEHVPGNVPDDAPSCAPDGEEDVTVVRAVDPNDIIGPDGYGEQNFRTDAQPFAYTIRFENDPKKATAAAQEVVITNQLPANLDWTTFRPAALGFGSNITQPTSRDQSFSTTRSALNDDGSPLHVDISVQLDPSRGQVTWRFRSIDPVTGQPPSDPFAGFLPVNDDTGKGEGFVSYSIRTKQGLKTGDRIENQASIVFDFNDPIITNTALNTLDVDAPTSQVQDLPQTVGELFNVNWVGNDGEAGSGIAGYDVYVAVDDQPYTLWLEQTVENTAQFSGDDGKQYRFYSIAVDNVGNRESKAPLAEAVTVVDASHVWHNYSLPLDVNDDGVVSPADALLIINELNNPRFSDPKSRLLKERTDTKLPFFDVKPDRSVAPEDALLVINALNATEAEGEFSKPIQTPQAAFANNVKVGPRPEQDTQRHTTNLPGESPMNSELWRFDARNVDAAMSPFGTESYTETLDQAYEELDSLDLLEHVSNIRSVFTSV